MPGEEGLGLVFEELSPQQCPEAEEEGGEGEEDDEDVEEDDEGGVGGGQLGLLCCPAVKPHRLHLQLERQLAVVIFVVEIDLDLELETLRLLHGTCKHRNCHPAAFGPKIQSTQRFQGDTCQVKSDVKFLYSVPRHRQVVLVHPLGAGVETKNR